MKSAKARKLITDLRDAFHGIMGQAMPEIAAIDEPPMLEGKAA